MVFNVRCFKCGEHDVRLVLGGRAVIHARCHGCDSNLLAEIMELQQQVEDDATGEEQRVEDTQNPSSTDSLGPVTTDNADEETAQQGGQ